MQPSDNKKLMLALALFVFVLITALTKNPIIGMIIAGLIGSKAFKKMDSKTIDITKGFKMKNLKLYSIIVIVIFLIIIYFFRPWFHSIFIIPYSHPVILFFLIAIAFTAFFVARKMTTLSVIFTVITVLLFLVIMFHEPLLQRYIVQETEYNKIDSLVDSTQLRIIPMAVARRYLEDSLQKSREHLGGIDLVNINGSLVWTTPRVPDGSLIYFTEKVNGLMVADATSSDRNTRLVNKELKVGEEIGVTDNIYWKLYKKEYFMQVPEIYYIMKGDNVYTIAPIIKYWFKFPVMIPYFAGVYVVDEKGIMSRYTPQETLNMELFENNWVFPETLARLYVDSYKYNLGFINTWFLHKDQIEITDVSMQGNRQPFLMPTEDGLKWIVATEPYGRSYGVFKLFVVDALTGKIDMIEFDEDDTLTGPVRAVSYVKKKFPIIDWATSRVVEPRPYVVNGDLYWMLSITPIDFAGVSYTVFVNSRNNEVVAFDNDEDAHSFSLGKAIEKTEEIKEEMKEDLMGNIASKIKMLEDNLAALKEDLGKLENEEVQG